MALVGGYGSQSTFLVGSGRGYRYWLPQPQKPPEPPPPMSNFERDKQRQSFAPSANPSDVMGQIAASAQKNFGVQDITKAFFQAGKENLQEYSKNISEYGPALRSLLFQASPELRQASEFLQERFANPIPESILNAYRNNLRQAQIARGFEGGQGPAMQEAELVTGLVEQQRSQLLPHLQNFGQSILGMTGFQAPPEITLPAVGGLQTEQSRIGLGYAESAFGQGRFEQQMSLAQRQFEAELYAASEQSEFARRQFGQTQSLIDQYLRSHERITGPKWIWHATTGVQEAR